MKFLRDVWLQDYKYTIQIIYFNNEVKKSTEKFTSCGQLRLESCGQLRLEWWYPDIRVPIASLCNWPPTKFPKTKKEKKKR